MQADVEAALTFRWSDFPTVSANLPGCGGRIRAEPEDFQVTEVPLYEPQGSGSHAYVLLEKRGLTTRDLVLALMNEGVSEKAIGVAGLKDKYAVTRQWLSVPNAQAEALRVFDSMEQVRVLEQSRHKNKLGIGHLAGNHFRIVVRETTADALAHSQQVLAFLKRVGLPNYFGPQRFGRFGRNAVDGYKLLKGEQIPGGHRLKRFFISALQSLLFNRLLAQRIERGYFDSLVLGDWAKKHDTGGVFRVDSELEAERAKRFEVSATLPLYGKKIKVSEAQAGELEQALLKEYDLSWQDFRARHGDRRWSRLVFAEVSVSAHREGLELSFFLPKGAFATTVLREVMKVDVDETSAELSEAALSDD